MMTFAVIRSLILLVLKNISLQCNAVSQPPNLDSVNINFFKRSFTTHFGTYKHHNHDHEFEPRKDKGGKYFKTNYL